MASLKSSWGKIKMNNIGSAHLRYILEKQRKTIEKFGIDNLGHSKGDFSDFKIEDDFETKILKGLLALKN